MLRAGGLAVSCKSVRCMPFVAAVLLRPAGLDALRQDARLDEPTDNCDRPPAPQDANGEPLSERSRWAGRTRARRHPAPATHASVSVLANAWQRNR